MSSLKKILRKKPYLAWDVKNTDRLSEESLFERILNYGDWDDYLQVEKLSVWIKPPLYLKNLKTNAELISGRRR